MRTDGEIFASLHRRFTPEERGRQRQLMGEIRDRMVVRHADMRSAFRDADEDRSGAVDQEEFSSVLAKAHIDLPPEDSKLLFAYGDEDGSGQVSYEEFCSAIERTLPWGNRYWALEPVEITPEVHRIMEKYSKADFARDMGRRINRAKAKRMAYYHMLDKDFDGYVSLHDFLQGAKALNMDPARESQVRDMFRELSAAQGGDGRLNFPLFGELLTPPPNLTGTGPFGGDYRLKEMEGVHRRREMLEESIRTNPASQRWASGYKTSVGSWDFKPDHNVPALRTFEPGSRLGLATGRGDGSKDGREGSEGAHEALALTASDIPVDPNATLSHSFNRTLDVQGYVVPDGPLARTQSLPALKRPSVPRRMGASLTATNRGSHANLVKPVETSSMWQPEATRLVRATHFADKWDSKADKEKRKAQWEARIQRRLANEERVAEMVKERQENVELTDLYRKRSLGAQSLWLMERTVGQL